MVAVPAALVAVVALRSGLERRRRQEGGGDPRLGGRRREVHQRRSRARRPALAMTAAIAPLALIAGGLILLFGGRRGMPIIGTSLGVLLLLGSVTALVD